LNSESSLWYDGRCGRFENFESARHFRIESNRNRPIRIRIESSQVPTEQGTIVQGTDGIVLFWRRLNDNLLMTFIWSQK